MPFCLGCVALFFPRLVCLAIYFWSDWFEAAIDSSLVLLAGFVFLPLTLLVYTWIVHANGSVEGLYFVPLVLAVLGDLGLIGSNARRKSD
ncbi:MAG: hypothetical protein HZA52_07670 [Planctomycetes bacterium]|nr:hypothetical protein [Planctomycetota bacterium]